MQGFHTTPAPRYAQADVSTIDFAVLPSREQLFGGGVQDNFSRVRVPLLPDNFAPNRAAVPGNFAPEASDAPLRAPEIVVMAADPSSVNAVSALTEVEAFSPDGVELSFAHAFGGPSRGGAAKEEQYAGGMLKGLWAGLKEDILSPGGQAKPTV